MLHILFVSSGPSIIENGRYDMRRITIIGGGASGTLVAANLLRSAASGLTEINLVERSSAVGRGVAYSTRDDIHLLNVPASRMGAFPDGVGHFLEWLRSKGFEYSENDFVPRRLFGEYLRDVLERAKSDRHEMARLNLFEDDAVDVSIQGEKAQVTLVSGEFLYSEKVVLAFGNFLPPHPTVRDASFTSHPKYFRSPWVENVFESIDSEASVLIIGTGLSMVDVVLKLEAAGHTGPVTAISTRGLLPAVHKLDYSYPSFAEELNGRTRVTEIFKIVRAHIKRAESDSSDWRAVIDSLRPATQNLWRNLPLSEKRNFMRHLSRYWNVARHRMPAEAAKTLDRLTVEGRLFVLKGRLQNIDVNGNFRLGYHADGRLNEVSADFIINCIGSESNFRKLGSPLVNNLFERGYIRSDRLNFGLDALPNGSVVGQNGQVNNVIFTLGTALKGTLWETTAIPEIRTQAARLAEVLLAD